MKEQNSGGILLICKDTGAANALSVFVSNLPATTTQIYSLCIGHAVKVFRQNGLKPSMESDTDLSQKEVKEVISTIKPGAIIMGTSLDSLTERYSVIEARKQGIYCLGLVDWWSNFGARFSTPSTNDLAYLPDEIAVMDDDARLGCIEDGIPDALLCITGNPYWDFLKARKDPIQHLRIRIRKKLGIGKGTIVAMVISSNIRNLNLNLGYDEHDFWKAIIPLPEYTRRGIPIQWAVKPHPREKPQDIYNMLEKYHINPMVLNGFSSIAAIVAADFVIGMCSSVLFEATLLGKKVVSVQPGMNIKKLRYLRIFDRIAVPKVVDVTKVKYIVERLVNDELAYPELEKMPYPIGNGKANFALRDLLVAGMKNKVGLT